MVSNHLFEGSVLGILYLEDLIHLEVNTISFQGRSFLEFGLLIIIIIIIINIIIIIIIIRTQLILVVFDTIGQ